MTHSLIFVTNCGSSSVKFAILDPKNEQTLVDGLIEKLGGDDVEMHIKANAEKKTYHLGAANHQQALEALVPLLPDELKHQLCAVGHRVVHGGEAFTKSCLINKITEQGIESCCQLAPLHNPANLLGIRACQEAFPKLPQVAVFDTAFHQTMPAHAYVYPLPYKLYQEQGIRRYGFHGISHQYVSHKAAEILDLDYRNCALLSAHLGNGCSATAILNGESVDTSMGFTPLEGLMMGTRSGDIDPSLHAYLINQYDYTIEDVTNLLNKESGLLGVSGSSMDMRDLWQQVEAKDKRASLAIEIFCYRLAKYLAALAVPLGKIDALIFTGGIGENDYGVREKVLNWLGILNFKLDVKANDNHGRNNNGIISQDDSPIAMVIKTDEQLLIAKEALKIIRRPS